MAQARYYSSTAQPTVLTSGITSVQTTINVLATTGFPASVPYILALDYNTPSEEIVLVTAQAGTTLTVTRAYDGTSGTTHNSSAGVRHTWTAKDGNDSRFHEGSSQNVHGIGALSSVVGTLDVQTLTNKTMTAPVLNNPTINSATFGGAINLPSPSITGTVTGGATYNSITLPTPAISSPTITGTVAGGASYTAPTITGNVPGDPTFTAGFAGGSTGQFDVDSSGNLTQAANMTMGAWTTFVPTWDATVTTPTLGNGTLTSQWSRVGRTIHWNGVLDLGNTSNGGTGLWTISIPTPAAAVGYTQYGSASYVDAGTNEYIGNVQIGSGGTIAVFVVKTSSNAQSAAQVSNTVPVGASQNTLLQWNITYQAAT